MEGLHYSEAAYRALKDAILGGTIGPGERLREQELSDRFRVSRTPIREALKKLEADGFVVNRPGRGLVVSEPSSEEIIETYLLREVIEGLAARLAAERASEIDLIRLEARLRGVDEAHKRGDSEQAIRMNIEFDLDIFRIAGSGRLLRLIEDLQADQRRFKASGLRYPGRLAQSIREHRGLLSAIRRHDPQAAESAARAHMRRARDTRIAMSVQQSLP